MDSKLTMIGDEELTAVSGGTSRRKKMPPGFVKREANAYGGSNQVFGDLDLDLRGKNTVIITVGDVTQSADATASA